MTPPHDRRAEGGFTLLELLVAMAIFATLSVMAHSGLTWLLTAEERLRDSRAALDELQRAVVLVSRDLRGVADRPVRIGHAQYDPPLVIRETSRDDAPLVELTRSGWSNPAQLKRSHFQRVAYELSDDGVLSRRYWPVLDRTASQPGIDAAILTGVNSFVVRAMGSDGEWNTQWPPATADDQPSVVSRQAGLARITALEFVLEHDSLGPIRRLIAFGGPPQEKDQDGSQ